MGYNPIFDGKIHGFPVDFPLNQSIDSWIYPKGIIVVLLPNHEGLLLVKISDPAEHKSWYPLVN